MKWVSIYRNEVIDLSRLPNLASAAKYRKLQYTGRMDGIGETRNAKGILVGKYMKIVKLQ
jgi:hypothetical protein